jgi:hypothetical protein
LDLPDLIRARGHRTAAPFAVLWSQERVICIWALLILWRLDRLRPGLANRTNVTLVGDELKWTQPTLSAGGPAAPVVWRRAK